MKKDREKTKQAKKIRSLLKRVSKAAVLAGGLLISTSAAAKTSELDVQPKTIEQRVKTVRASLTKKLAGAQNLADKLSYSERELAQWGNWGNWGNWNNWVNWNNWNNWANWGNWGNY